MDYTQIGIGVLLLIVFVVQILQQKKIDDLENALFMTDKMMFSMGKLVELLAKKEMLEILEEETAKEKKSKKSSKSVQKKSKTSAKKSKTSKSKKTKKC